MEREQITIRLPVEMKVELQRLADARGHSFNGFINLVFSRAIEFINQGLL